MIPPIWIFTMLEEHGEKTNDLHQYLLDYESGFKIQGSMISPVLLILRARKEMGLIQTSALKWTKACAI